MSQTSALAERTYGPFLRFRDYQKPTADAAATWSGSILFACKDVDVGQGNIKCHLEYRKARQVLEPEVLDQHAEWIFLKFTIQLDLTENEEEVSYQLQLGDDSAPQDWWSFYVPGGEAEWKIAAYSCSGFSESVDEDKWMQNGDHPMVYHLMQNHGEKRIHLCVGGGDQLYNDRLFELNIMGDWLKVPNRAERLQKPYTDEMKEQTEDFYFANYCKHFSVGSMRNMCGNLPNIMLWDDHDIFDGWGSYPPDMMRSPVFKGIFEVARRFYLLFQHHTTLQQVEDGESDLFLGKGEEYKSMSYFKLIGPNVALFGVDIRSERSRSVVLSDESWKDIFHRLANISPSIKHLIVLFTVPILYPEVPIVESTLRLVSNLSRFGALNALLVKSNVVSSRSFGEPALLDDLVDHWNSHYHQQERKHIVQCFQKLAWQHNLRVTFLSGDVHCAALGRFCTDPKVTELVNDPYFMSQVVTSALINEPPPSLVVSALHMFDTAGNRINGNTREKMVRLFQEESSSEEKVMPRRNFVTIQQFNDTILNGQSLKIIYHVENKDDKRSNPKKFQATVPELLAAYSGAGTGRQEPKSSLPKLSKTSHI